MLMDIELWLKKGLILNRFVHIPNKSIFLYAKRVAIVSVKVNRYSFSFYA